MSTPSPLKPFLPQLTRLCEEYGVSELSAFGSVLREDFGEASDVDLLVDFLPSVKAGLFHMIRLQRAIEGLLGRPVDLVPKSGLKPAIRNQVLSAAEPLYAA